MSEAKGERAMRAMGSEKKKESKSEKKHKVHKMEIRHAANGGFIVEHKHKPEPGEMMPQDPEEHQVPDVASLQQHVAENMGDGQAAPPPAGAPDPGAAAPPAAAPAQ